MAEFPQGSCHAVITFGSQRQAYPPTTKLAFNDMDTRNQLPAAYFSDLLAEGYTVSWHGGGCWLGRGKEGRLAFGARAWGRSAQLRRLWRRVPLPECCIVLSRMAHSSVLRAAHLPVCAPAPPPVACPSPTPAACPWQPRASAHISSALPLPCIAPPHLRPARPAPLPLALPPTALQPLLREEGHPADNADGWLHSSYLLPQPCIWRQRQEMLHSTPPSFPPWREEWDGGGKGGKGGSSSSSSSAGEQKAEAQQEQGGGQAGSSGGRDAPAVEPAGRGDSAAAVGRGRTPSTPRTPEHPDEQQQCQPDQEAAPSSGLRRSSRVSSRAAWPVTLLPRAQLWAGWNPAGILLAPPRPALAAALLPPPQPATPAACLPASPPPSQSTSTHPPTTCHLPPTPLLAAPPLCPRAAEELAQRCAQGAGLLPTQWRQRGRAAGAEERWEAEGGCC